MCIFTCFWVSQNFGRYYSAELGEHPLQIGLVEVLVQTAHVQVGAFDRVRAWSSERHFDGLILQTHSIQSIYGFLSILLLDVIDECVA